MGHIQSSSRPGGIESSLSALHVLHLLLLRLCWQMPDPPHSLHAVPVTCSSQLCWQMISRLCRQMFDPPHSLHALLPRLCWQMPDPLHSLHSLLRRLFSHWPELHPRALFFHPLLPASSPSTAARFLLPYPLSPSAALLPPAHRRRRLRAPSVLAAPPPPPPTRCRPPPQ